MVLVAISDQSKSQLRKKAAQTFLEKVQLYLPEAICYRTQLKPEHNNLFKISQIIEDEL